MFLVVVHDELAEDSPMIVARYGEREDAEAFKAGYEARRPDAVVEVAVNRMEEDPTGKLPVEIEDKDGSKSYRWLTDPRQEFCRVFNEIMGKFGCTARPINLPEKQSV